MQNKKRDISSGCAEWCDQVQAILDLPAEDEIRKAWEKHAASCEDCAALLESEKRLHAHLADLPDPGPARISQSVMNRIRLKERKQRLFRLRDLGWGIAGSVAGILLGILLANVSETKTTEATTVSGYEQMLTDLERDFDPLLTVMFADESESGDRQ